LWGFLFIKRLVDLEMIKHVIPLMFLIGLSYSQGGGYALDFDGTNDYVTMGDVLDQSSDFTIMAWVYAEDATYSAIASKRERPSNYYGWSLVIENDDGGGGDDGVEFDVQENTAGGGVAARTARVLTTWKHYVGVFDANSSVKLYQDGSLAQSNTSSVPSSLTGNSAHFLIGSLQSGGTWPFNGKIDEISVWNAALSQSQIQGYMHKVLDGDESNLVAYYQMSNGSGTSLTDNSSNSNTGTLTNMVTSGGSSDWVTSYAPIGDLNSSYETDVEAIWKVSGTSASDASDGLTMTVSSALSTGNFAVFGNNNTNGTSTSDLGSVGSTNRTGRIWQVDESGTVAGTITIDISDATGNAGQSGTASNFRLLYRSGTSGDFSSAATGASISGDAVSFTSVSLADGYYALGSESDASLPVELTSFEVLDTRANGITLHWITESEINNLGFILDRRTPTIDWIEIASFVTDTELQGQGSVSHQTIYTYSDNTVTDDETYDYRIADVDYDGNKESHSLQLMGISPASIPSTYVLHQNYPNPFNPVTTLSYDLPEDALVNITIYDMMGKVVRTLINMEQTVGYRSVQWHGTNNNGSPVSAGIYLYTIQAGDYRQTKKMVLLK
jgi:hypothetical protein